MATRVKKLKGQWRRLRCSKDFSAFAAGGSEGFDFPAIWTRNTAESPLPVEIFTDRLQLRFFLAPFAKKSR